MVSFRSRISDPTLLEVAQAEDLLDQDVMLVDDLHLQVFAQLLAAGRAQADQVREPHHQLLVHVQAGCRVFLVQEPAGDGLESCLWEGGDQFLYTLRQLDLGDDFTLDLCHEFVDEFLTEVKGEVITKI